MIILISMVFEGVVLREGADLMLGTAAFLRLLFAKTELSND